MTLSGKLFNSAKRLLPDNVVLSLYHRRRIGRFPNLRNPTTYNEKILHRCLHPDPRYIDLSDKLKVRDYVANKIGSEYLIPLIDAPAQFDRGVFEALPSSFVMKANHGSGFVKVVSNKKETSFEELDALAKRWLATNFYKVARERHYRPIEPRIFFEKLLLEPDGKVPADMKFHIFNKTPGDPKIIILLIADRFGARPTGDMYDTDWNMQDISIGSYSRSPTPAPRPPNLDKLVSVAHDLSTDFEFVRIDLYNSHEGIFFGEMTFTPGAGLFVLRPDKVDYEWGHFF